MLRKSAYEEASGVAIGEDSTLLWMACSMNCKGVPTEEAAGIQLRRSALSAYAAE